MPFDINMIRTGGVEQDRGTPYTAQRSFKTATLITGSKWLSG